jgi:adenylate cyclase
MVTPDDPQQMRKKLLPPSFPAIYHKQAPMVEPCRIEASMSTPKPNGELVPVGGGDNIPLLRPRLTIGRRESCDIEMNFPNISSLHCELVFRDGYWYIRDLNSTNGVKVNGTRVQGKLLRSKDEVTIGKRVYTIEYEMPIGGLVEERETEDIFSQSLLERAGLEKGSRERQQQSGKRRSTDPVENFLMDDDDD